MTKIDTYSSDAKKTGTIELPEEVFALPWNESLVHQIVVSMQSNARTPVAHTKDRSDVRGGGRKPWRQKGTGRARHGSIRSPLWKGGGVTFGPRNEKDFSKAINKKMRTKALFVTLSKKVKDEEVLFVDALSFEKPSASEAKKSIDALSKVKGFEGMATKKKNNILVITVGNDRLVAKSFNNFGNVEVDDVRNLNAVDVLRYKHLVIVSPKEAVEALSEKGKKVLGSNKGHAKTVEEKATNKSTPKKVSKPDRQGKTTKKVAKKKTATNKTK